MTGGNPNKPADWEMNPEKPPRSPGANPIIRRAYDEADPDCKPLSDILSDCGGGFVWRHDDGNQKDYYVGSQLVLKYYLRAHHNRLGPEQAVDRTVVSKQWISQEILKKEGYDYKDCGEGEYAIQARLTPVRTRILSILERADPEKVQVVNLHNSASKRTETSLRTLSKHTPQTAPPKPVAQQLQRARALCDFSPSEANQGELPFKQGDILQITEKRGAWWGAKLNGKQGWVPYNYVQVLAGTELAATETQTNNSVQPNSSENVSSSTDREPKSGLSKLGRKMKAAWTDNVVDLKATKSTAKLPTELE